MAVEAHRRCNLFPRDFVNCSHQLNQQQMLFPAIPIPATLVSDQPFVCNSILPKTSIKTKSCVTSSSRKRCREDSFAGVNFRTLIPPCGGGSFLLQIQQQQQMEIDAIVSHHTKKIKSELQQRQKEQTKMLIDTIGEGVMTNLKEKDEQIQRMVKLNMVLQERVKNLYLENQLWRDVAQSNEATAVSLRSDLEQALQAQVGCGGERVSTGGAAVDDDVVSCCDSNTTEGDKNMECDGGIGKSCYSERKCRWCGEGGACVLLLPCRHLCLCSACGSGSHQVKSCPVCDSSMNATLHVNYM